MLYSGAPLIQGNIIAGNPAFTCSESAVISSTSDTGIQIIGNLIAANNGAGISLSYGTGNAAILQNTILQNSGGGFYQYAGNASPTLVQNWIANNQRSRHLIFQSSHNRGG